MEEHLDSYNEPMNVARVGTAAWLREIFLAARQAGPAQPLTISVWNGNGEINEVMLTESDVVSFHRYGPHDAVLGQIVDLKRRGRPVVCTEWMARPTGSRIETDLPMFKQEAVGEHFGAAGSFWIFGGICLAGFFYILKVLPETRGKSLEGIEREFVD